MFHIERGKKFHFGPGAQLRVTLLWSLFAGERLEGQDMLGCGRPPCSLLFESGWKRQTSQGRPWECPMVFV